MNPQKNMGPADSSCLHVSLTVCYTAYDERRSPVDGITGLGGLTVLAQFAQLEA